MSPFVLQKIRERREAAEQKKAAEAIKEEAEEAEEEAEEAEEEAEEDLEDAAKAGALVPERRGEPLVPLRRSHHKKDGGAGAALGSLSDRIGRFWKKLGPTETVLVVGGGLLFAQHLMVPRGTSILSKVLNAVAPTPKAAPRLARAGFDDYAGANLQAGWNRGVKPYGGWAHASPGGPWPYAHGGPERWGW